MSSGFKIREVIVRDGASTYTTHKLTATGCDAGTAGVHALIRFALSRM
jgi:hypothetical protein